MTRRRSSTATADIEREAFEIANEAHRLRLQDLEAQLSARPDETAEAARRLAEPGGRAS